MNCVRCSGFMEREWHLVTGEWDDIKWVRLWRCLNCGDLLDEVIERRRTLYRDWAQHPPRRLLRQCGS